jgi:tetratricopeptide (TPR) repeat protein
MERSAILVLLLVSLLQVAAVLAFVAPSVPTTCCQQQRRGVLLFAQQDSNAAQDDTNDNDDDVEAARRRLEFLVSDGTEVDADAEEEAPLLSTIGRERREAEISMLRELEYSDEASDDLWQLWYSERGPKASADLKEIEEELFGDMSEWDHAEERLQEMIKEHGMHFVEPLNRLATLYYMQGRYEDSKRYCEAVLDQKPWHFGALSGIVMVCANLQDMNGARQWASRRLPPIPPDGTTNERRSEWVERAVEDARKALLEEEVRIRLAFGRKQRYERKQQEAQQQSSEEDAWQ